MVGVQGNILKMAIIEGRYTHASKLRIGVVVARLNDGQATLVEGQEFDRIQPLIETELEEREISS